MFAYLFQNCIFFAALFTEDLSSQGADLSRAHYSPLLGPPLIYCMGDILLPIKRQIRKQKVQTNTNTIIYKYEDKKEEIQNKNRGGYPYSFSSFFIDQDL